MKILVCTSEYPPLAGGIGNQVKDLVEELKRDFDIEIDICTPSGPDIKMGSHNLIRKSGRIGLLHYWNETRKFIKKNQGSYDIFWYHNPLFIHNLDVESIVTIHNTTAGQLNNEYSFFRGIYKRLASKIERYALNKIKTPNNQFICISNQVNNELKSILSIDNDFKIISNGIDTNKFSPSNQKEKIRSDYGIPLDKTVFISVGRLVDVKQPLKAIKIHQYSSNIKSFLLMVGDGPLRSELEDYVNDRKIENVKFMGNVPRDKLPELYNAADYYVMTSKYEGLPITLLEAMSSGLPCMVTDIPSLRIVEDADCGVLLDFRSSQYMELIKAYVKEYDKSQSNNARKYALEYLNLSKVAGDYYHIFKGEK